MKIPYSWLNEYVDINCDLEELASHLTMTGLEVNEILLVGMGKPEREGYAFKYSGLSWDAEKFVVAQVDEVMPHPNADRLVLCRLNDGDQELIVLTGAPNLYPYKGKGLLEQPLKVAYAREGAILFDGHKPGFETMKLKRAKIRGVESFSMICSEKELGISDEHEGVIILDADAPTGKSLKAYMGDAVLDVEILPNMIRNANIVGVARELSAVTGWSFNPPKQVEPVGGPPLEGQVEIEITKPELNPRFVFGLVRDVTILPSPYWVQRRLRLAGMRPISSVVDATNYAMLDVGEPLHAFDYDILVERAGGKVPKIITRTAEPGEKLTTLDDIERELDDFTTLVTDTQGALAIAGVMGGAESEVSENTRNVLLEGASWNFINVRKTVASQHLISEASYRFSRGIHPEAAPVGVKNCLQRIVQWSNGEVAAGLVDAYPQPHVDPTVTLTAQDVKRALGIELSVSEMGDLLKKLEFVVNINGDALSVTVPPHRMDIGEGVIGKADLIEEVARLYGYDNIPSTRLSDTLPPQRNNPLLQGEEKIKDTLISLGLQEIVSYRLTHPERELRLLQPEHPMRGEEAEISYVTLKNPISQERSVMRQSLLACVLEALERNIRNSERLAFFEVGPVFLPMEGDILPHESQRLSIGMTGRRSRSGWDRQVGEHFSFYDLKGALETLFSSLHIKGISYLPCEDGVDTTAAAPFHPGKCAVVMLGEDLTLGVFGELHPLVKENFDLGGAPVLAAELDLGSILAAIPARHVSELVPVFPPVLEDIAVIVDEDLPAVKVEEVICGAGGKLLAGVRLFDIFRGPQIGPRMKSLAYSLTYMAPDRTLTDKEAAKVRKKIIRRLEQELGAKLRS
jgi:phenylalanyl-tRNA synthetase beta chain